MAEEKIALVFQADGADKFTKATKETEIALRRQARALNESQRAIQQEIIALKAATQPNKSLIAEKQRLIQQYALEQRAIRAKVTAMREEAAAANAASKQTKGMTVASTALTGSLRSLATAFAGVIGLFSVGAIIKTADEFNQLKAKVTDSLDSINEFDGTMKKLVSSSNRSGASLDAVAQSFVRLRPAAKELGVTNDQLIKFSETFTKMGALAGATSEEIKNATIQLAQGIGSGALRGDELRSVMEQMPQVARAIAQSMGIPFKEFKKAAEDGKITAEAVFKAILDKASEVDERFANLPASIQRSLVVAINSWTLFVDVLNQALGLTDGMAAGISLISEQLGRLTQSMGNANSTTSIWVGIVNQLAGALAETVKTVVAVYQALDTLWKGIFEGQTLFQGFTKLVGFLAIGLDTVATAANIAAQAILGLVQAAAQASERDFKGAVKTLKARVGDIKEAAVGFVGRTRQATGQKKSIGRATLRQPPKQDSGAGGGGGASGDKDKSNRKAIQAEREKLNALKEELSGRLDDIALASRKQQQELPLGANEAEKLNIKMAAAAQEAKTIFEYSKKFVALQINTKEAQADRKRLVQDLNRDIKSANMDIVDLGREGKEAQETFGRDILRLKQEAERAVMDNNLEAQKAQFEELRARVGDAFADNQITVQQYYDTERDLIERNARLEIYRIGQRIEQLDTESVKLRQTDADRKRRLEIENEIDDLVRKRTQTQDQADAAKRSQDREEKKALAETGKQLKQDFQGNLSEAIQAALEGQGDAIKNFAKAIRSALTKAISDALAARVAKALDPVFQKIGEWLNSLSGVSGKGGSVLPQNSLFAPRFAPNGVPLPGKGNSGIIGKLQGLFGGTGGKIAGGALAGIGGGFAGFSVGKESGSILGGAGTGALSGAMLGLSLGGGPIGAAIGAVVGAIGGTIGGIFGKSKNKKEAKKQKEIEQYTARYNTIVQGADANNLQDLTARYNQINATKSKGSATFALKKQAVAQIEQLMADRKKAIAAAIKEIAAQNEELVAQISLIGATPGDAFEIKRKIELRKVELETQALLEQYKDSEEAKTKILEQETLRRQLLMKEEQDAMKDNVANLQDLLIQRDDISNANVFQRLRSRETQKSDQLTELDREIASRVLEMQKALELGVQPLNTRGLNQVLQQVRSIGTVNADLQVIINQADDPNAVREEVTRAFESFMQKIYGANAA